MSERDYARYCAGHKMMPESVDCARRKDAYNCWRELYWRPAQCEQLPLAVATFHLSHAIHTGLPSAQRTLRRTLLDLEGLNPYGLSKNPLEGPLREHELTALAGYDAREIATTYLLHWHRWLDEIVARDAIAAQEFPAWTGALDALRARLIPPTLIAPSAPVELAVT